MDLALVRPLARGRAPAGRARGRSRARRPGAAQRRRALAVSALQAAAVAGGGAVGALLRYWVSTGVHGVLGRDFPYGTLAVNVAGSLAMGLLYVLLVERSAASPELRAALLIGLLGAFTTFSTWSLETVTLLVDRELGKAALNTLLSVAFCLGATWLGIVAGRQL